MRASAQSFTCLITQQRPQHALYSSALPSYAASLDNRQGLRFPPQLHPTHTRASHHGDMVDQEHGGTMGHGPQAHSVPTSLAMQIARDGRGQETGQHLRGLTQAQAQARGHLSQISIFKSPPRVFLPCLHLLAIPAFFLHRVLG